MCSRLIVLLVAATVAAASFSLNPQAQKRRYVEGGNRTPAQQSLQQVLKLNPTFEGAEDAKRALATIKG